MEEAMTQLLAQRMGLSGEQYDALRSGNPDPLLTNQVSDPLIAALFSSMLTRKSESAEVSSDTQHDHSICERELRRAKRTIAKLKDNLASADAMANHIADIFGACEFCWGLNKLCPRCGGRGWPGFTEPKQEELLGWIEPALRKLGLTVIKSSAG
jgi:hypothetical protein